MPAEQASPGASGQAAAGGHDAATAQPETVGEPSTPQASAAGLAQPGSNPGVSNPEADATPRYSPLDDKAQRLAEFFNGEIVDLEGPLTDLHDAA